MTKPLFISNRRSDHRQGLGGSVFVRNNISIRAWSFKALCVWSQQRPVFGKRSYDQGVKHQRNVSSTWRIASIKADPIVFLAFARSLCSRERCIRHFKCL